MTLRERIEHEARRLGFQLFGVTTPDPPAHYDIYREWIKRGFHGKMQYLETERAMRKRKEPREILEGCRSIIVLGAGYSPARENDTESTNRKVPTGRVATYAWGEDYHLVIAMKLTELVDFIERESGHSVPHKSYVDTGPILERDLAQRAGLGWIGKNTCLIAPQAGSFFFLAEILLGIYLEPDKPFVNDHCGSCNRCIDACPTDCILPNRTIDASRCISYLTIELREHVPVDLRSKMGNWVFGCDICQEVCPWNERFGKHDVPPEFNEKPGRARPNLREDIKMNQEDFSKTFRHSPIKRTKKAGYNRNIAIALGNLGDKSTVPSLAGALLENLDPMVRAHIAWALGNIGGDSAISALFLARDLEKDPTTRAEIWDAYMKAVGKRMI